MNDPNSQLCPPLPLRGIHLPPASFFLVQTMGLPFPPGNDFAPHPALRFTCICPLPPRPPPLFSPMVAHHPIRPFLRLLWPLVCTPFPALTP